MIPFRHILFPVDYSDGSKAMVPWVTQMATHFNATITLLHAYAPDFLAYVDLAPKYAELNIHSRAFEENRLREFAHEAFPGRSVTSIIMLADPAAAVESVVEHQGADLIMLPTHGRGPAGRLFLGSVTTKVLHHVSAAVWTATPACLKGVVPPRRYQSILSVVDDTDEAEVILRASAALAAEFQAQLRIAHVVMLPTPSPGLDFRHYQQILRNSATERLRELTARLGIDAPYTVLEGPVPHAIREEAVSRDLDLIVTGRGISQEAFTSVFSRLYDVIRDSPCPVLSI